MIDCLYLVKLRLRKTLFEGVLLSFTLATISIPGYFNRKD
jgi:hypothetical protein